MRRACFVCIVGLGLALACGSKTEQATVVAPPPAHGVDLDGMDRRVRPGDDFFAYANGTWLAKTEIPADRSSWGTGAMVAELTDKRVADLIQDAAAIESKGLAPLHPSLDAIAAIADQKGLAKALGGSIRADVDALNNTNFE